MPEIASEIYIAKSPAEVYVLAKDLEGLAPYLKDVDKLSVREVRGNTSTSEWAASAMGKKIRWVEIETWYDDELRNTFTSPEGDFERYEGGWRFEPDGEGTRVRLEISYQLNLPLFGGLLQKLIRKLMQENTDGFLRGLKARAES